MSKTGKTVSLIVGTIVVVFLIQYGRFYTKINKLSSSMGLSLPISYFPFNGTWLRTTDGSIKKG